MSHPDRQSDHDRVQREEDQRRDAAEKERPKPGRQNLYSFDRLREQVMRKVPPEEATIALRNLQALTQGYILALDDIRSDMDRIDREEGNLTFPSCVSMWLQLRSQVRESRASAVETVRVLEEQVQQRTAEIVGGVV